MAATKSECDLILERFRRRDPAREGKLYSYFDRTWLLFVQERHRVSLEFISSAAMGAIEELRVLDVGCGDGRDLLTLLAAGFRPENLVGIDLREEMITGARARLPAAVKLDVGDAASLLSAESASFDIVMHWAVFSSVLDKAFQENLAARMWSVAKPGGAVLWYDFIYNNPKNPDVRGVPLRRVRELFPDGSFKVRRVTLAPPIARFVSRIHPNLYWLLNSIPFLQTHILCWITKPLRGPTITHRGAKSRALELGGTGPRRQ